MCYQPGSCKTPTHNQRVPKPPGGEAEAGSGAEGNKERGKPGRKDTRLPVTPLILRAAKRILAERPGVDSMMIWAAMCIGFFGFMRTGEFTVSDSHTVSRVLDLSVDSRNSRENLQHVNLRLRSSKTDQYGEGVTVSLARNDTDPCPVAAVLAYVAERLNLLASYYWLRMEHH